MNPSFRLWIARSLHQFLVCAIFTLSLLGSDPSGVHAIWLKALLVLALASLGIQYRLERESFRGLFSSIRWPMIFVATFVLYVVWQSDPLHQYPARQFLSHFAASVSFFLILIPLVRYPSLLQRLTLYLSVIGLLTALFGVAYRFTGSWDFLGRDASQLASGSFGFFYYENTYGAFAALLLPSTTALLIYRYLRREESGSAVLGNVLRPLQGYLSSGILLLGATLIVMGIGLFVTNARASLLILLVLYSTVAILFLPLRLKIVVMTLIALSAFAFVLLASSKLLETTLSVLSWERLSEDARTRWEIIRSNLALVAERPWTGWGMGTYKYVASQKVSLFTDNNLVHIWEHHHAHGSFMDLLVEGGAIGLILLSLAVLALFAGSWSAYRDDGSLYRRLMARQSVLALVSFAPMLLTDSHLRVPAVALLMIFQLAILVGASKPYVYDEEPLLADNPGRERFGEVPVIMTYTMIALCGILIGADLVRSHRVFELTHTRMHPDQRMLKLTQAEPRNPEYWAEASSFYFDRSLKAEDPGSRDQWGGRSVDAIRKAIDLAPTYAYYRFILAYTLYHQGDTDGAIEAFRQAIDRAPSSLKYRADLMLIYIFEAQNNPSVLRRNQWNLEARKLYHRIKSDNRYPPSGFEKLNLFLGRQMTPDQKRYLKDFMVIANKYGQEMEVDQAKS